MKETKNIRVPKDNNLGLKLFLFFFNLFFKFIFIF